MGRKPRKLDDDGMALLVLIAYRFDQISIGRAREILGWPDAEIRKQAPMRVGRRVICRECGEDFPVQEECVQCWEKRE